MVDLGYINAVEDFRQARRRAVLEEILARLTGRPNQLLSFDDVRQGLGTRGRVERGLQEIPLSAIVGSVGRYADFTRGFLPRQDNMKERWARVKRLTTDGSGWPPIEVYRLGDVYFVLDGNHRVSIARQMGFETIPAFVTEIRTPVPLSPDDSPDEIIVKARYAEFMEKTGLAHSRAEADLKVTAPGAYRTLQEHIRVHRYFMGLEERREIGYAEAAAHWYDAVYQPIAHLIREKGLLRDFPDRTETDLYLWLAEHRAELEEALGWDVEPADAAQDLVLRQSKTPRRVLARVGDRLRDAVLLDELEPGPPPGAWRTGRVADRDDDRFFVDILVALNGEDSGWKALDQALQVARYEQTGVRGLHVVPTEEAANSEQVGALQRRFQEELASAAVEGKLVVEAGPVPNVLCDRSRWNDLVVIPLNYPPDTQLLRHLSSGMRQVVARCTRPILAVPAVTPLRRALLAYDGSAKAEEALYIATYVAARWETELVLVVVAQDDLVAEEVLPQAQAYLQEHGVDARFEVVAGSEVDMILATAERCDCDFFIMGGYRQRPVVEMVVGSTVTGILRHADRPVLIAR